MPLVVSFSFLLACQKVDAVFTRQRNMLYISFFVILLFIPMVHPNAADAIFHRDSATCIGDSSDASDADPLSDDEW